VRHLDDRAGGDRRFRSFDHVDDERPIEFEYLRRQLLDIGKRGVTGAEVVDGDLDAALAQPLQRRRRLGSGVEEQRFGDFEFKIVWRGPLGGQM